MDKFEYKVSADEIKSLIAAGEYAQAAEIADTIDWRRVKSVMMLCTISDLYKINGRYEDAKNILLLAYERRPGGRMICYSLCELCIKTEDFLGAVEYYKEFTQVAPKDSGRYVLQYKLLCAQDVSLEERIAVLEELKSVEYREKWAFELAYLYHRVGMATQCVEECDELILWFGNGKYVVKAMELKMLHKPLTPEQQEKYDHRFDLQEAEETKAEAAREEPAKAADTVEVPEGSADVQGSLAEAPEGAADAQGSLAESQAADNKTAGERAETQAENGLAKEASVAEAQEEKAKAEAGEAEDEDEQLVKTVDVSEYNTINLQAELAEGLKEVLGKDAVAGAILAPVPEPEAEQGAETDAEGTEVFFGETEEMAAVQPEIAVSTDTSDMTELTLEDVAEPEDAEPEDTEPEDAEPEDTEPEDAEPRAAAAENEAITVQPPKGLESVLTQEPDGQIRIVLPESEAIEKQITGQLNIDDILAEWERMKKQTEEKRKEEVRQHVLQQTGTMFTEFEASVRDGLLEKLESGVPVNIDAELAAVTGRAGETEEADEVEELEEIEDTKAVEEHEEVEETEELEEVEEAEEPEGSGEVDEIEEIEEVEEFQEPQEPEETQEPDEVEEFEELREADEPEEFEEVEDPWEITENEPAKVRSLTQEERELYAPYIQSRSARERLVKAIDGLSLAAYTGNLIITGEEGMDTLTLAANMIREVKATDRNFSGKVAKVSGQGLNQRDLEATVNQLNNGALIINKASGMNQDTASLLQKLLQKESRGIIVVLEDTRKAMNRLLSENPKLAESFTARMDVEALSNDALVAFGKQYAKEKEFAIDDLGVLALHTRIEELQTIDHAATVIDVVDIMDDAIRHASRKTIGHFFDILFGKRYNEEDMIILTEKDFV